VLDPKARLAPKDGQDVGNRPEPHFQFFATTSAKSTTRWL